MITNTDQIKEAITVEMVLQDLGYELNGMNKCACPVHEGKDKNFSVKDGIGRCFSRCGETWDAIGLLMECKSFTFPEALQYAAKITRTPVKYQTGTDAQKTLDKAKQEYQVKESYYLLNKAVADAYFNKTYINKSYTTSDKKQFSIWGQKAESLNWGVGRTITNEAIEAFQLSFSPEKNYHFITNIAEKAKLNLKKLEESGVIKIKADGSYRDRFVDKVIIPIHSEKGKIAGFTVRQHPDRYNDKFPKYLNSSESIVYKKNEILYGLYQNKRTIRKQDNAIFVEGNFDVISLWQHEVQNVVAASGTSITKQQVKLLGKYTKNVTLLMDGDDAGIKATKRSIGVLMEQGLNVLVAELPVGEDPDTFIRKHNKKGFDVFLSEKSKVGIQWLIEKDLGEHPNMFDRTAAIETAAKIVAKVEDNLLRDEFGKIIAKVTGRKLDTIKEKIKTFRDLVLDNYNRFLYTPQQMSDIEKYGFYEKNNAYHFVSDTKESQISNFTIKPLFLVKSRNNQRLFEVTNQIGEAELIAETTKVFVSLGNFNTAVENVGNFLFEGNDKQFIRLKRKIYNEMKVTRELNVLGHNPDGFWAWGNGIYVYEENKFIETDEYGIVQYNNQHYYLPALSKVNNLLDSADSDAYSEEKNFIYKPAKVTFEEWATQFIKVHGNNGKIGLLYYLSSLYRDLIFPSFDFFPHINSVGPTGSGKSFMMWSISAMYGVANKPFMLKSGTDVSFFNRWLRFRNGFTWFDEYFNDIDPKRVQYLKYAFDGVGREKGQKEDNRSLKSAVISSTAITGQDIPTADQALFNRLINLMYSKAEFTEKEQEEAEKLKQLDRKAGLSGLTSQLAAHRNLIQQEFSLTFDRIYSKMMKEVSSIKNIPTRLIKSNCILLTVEDILREQLTLPFSDSWKVIKDNMIRHAQMLGGSNETSEFFDVFNYMLDNSMINEKRHYKLKNASSLTIMINKTTKETELKQLGTMKQILLFNFGKIHPMYLESCSKQRRKAQGKTTLLHYLQTMPEFIGTVKNVRGVGVAMAFDLSGINERGIDLNFDTDYDDDDDDTSEDKDFVNPVVTKADKEAAGVDYPDDWDK